MLKSGHNDGSERLLQRDMDRLRLSMVVLGVIIGATIFTGGSAVAKPPACFPQFGMPCEDPGLIERLGTWIAQCSTLLLWLGYRYLRGRWPFKPRAAAARPVSVPEDRAGDWVTSAATRMAEVAATPVTPQEPIAVPGVTQPPRRPSTRHASQRAHFGTRR